MFCEEQKRNTSLHVMDGGFWEVENIKGLFLNTTTASVATEELIITDVILTPTPSLEL